ncbi:SDR family NAD(P)-dependent oxidoreductase [Hazenella coriacea]|uniref:Short-subunit dehydrogenase n=1 Tax=Hazenella coriacea TaxID=1179467 RepID=A0A4V2UVI0_9BACL|nr:SDR family oxidoreductase [Hazenella coriacea]TCS95847.1 hypothetical protein EDD58_102429 [Hazenella coriacea]
MTSILITGASSGIGEALAENLGKEGHRLILVARRETELQRVANQVRQMGGSAEIFVADLTQETDLLRLEKYIQSHPIDLLINNAGLGLYGTVTQTDSHMEQKLLQLNIEALVRLTRAILPQLQQRDGGGILFVSSILSFMPTPYMTAYGASKSFVLSYGTSLATELRNTNITISVLCPGSTQSEFATRAGFNQQRTMSAEKVARIALQQFKKGKTIIIPGLQNQITSYLPRFFSPLQLAHIVARLFRNR